MRKAIPHSNTYKLTYVLRRQPPRQLVVEKEAEEAVAEAVEAVVDEVEEVEAVQAEARAVEAVVDVEEAEEAEDEVKQLRVGADVDVGVRGRRPS